MTDIIVVIFSVRTQKDLEIFNFFFFSREGIDKSDFLRERLSKKDKHWI